MEFIDVLKRRRAIRKFSSRKISDKKITELIKLANLSPSAGNIQARALVIVKNQKTIKKIKDVTSGLRRFENNIPILLVVLAKPNESAERFEKRGKNLYALQDATIFAAYIQLIAVSKKLSTCWVGSFNENKIARILNLPKTIIPVAMLPMGYPAEIPLAKDRKALKEIILKKV